MLASLLKKVLRAQPESGLRARLQLGYSRLLADDARGASEIALALTARNPGSLEAHLLLARAAAAGKQWKTAVDSLERVLALQPAHAEAHYLRGLIHEDRNRPDAAIADFARVLDIDPSHAGALDRKGALHDARGDFEQALACARRLAETHTRDASASSKLGIILRELGRLDEAAAAFGQALALEPGMHVARCHLALVYSDMGRFADAESELATVLAANGEHPEARWVRAVCALLQGRFETAWDEYEYRDALAKVLPVAGIPRWSGQALADGALLVHAEQGLGDQIMFASCLSDALQLSPACVVECDGRLQALFQRSFPGAHVVARPQTRPALETRVFPLAVSAQIPLGTLPQLFRRQRSAFPSHTGYLCPDPAAVARWRRRLDGLGHGVKVGLSWTGGAAKTRRQLRSLSLERLLPLLAAGPCRFVSLQYVDSTQEIATVHARHGISVHTFAQDSYDDTAALVAALDLVVSVCTAVVHLAGAVGTPVWIMAPAAPEWRYGADGTAMPWYPSARIFRQRRLGDWDEVITSIAAEARTMAHGTCTTPEMLGETDAR